MSGALALSLCVSSPKRSSIDFLWNASYFNGYLRKLDQNVQFDNWIQTLCETYLFIYRTSSNS